MDKQMRNGARLPVERKVEKPSLRPPGPAKMSTTGIRCIISRTSQRLRGRLLTNDNPWGWRYQARGRIAAPGRHRRSVDALFRRDRWRSVVTKAKELYGSPWTVPEYIIVLHHYFKHKGE